MLSAFAGLAAGALHVFSGPDHLAAMAPIAVDNPSRATWLGFKWGLGHGFGALLVGALALAARSALGFEVNIEALSGWSEFVVGLILVGIGLWAFQRARGIVIHEHPHEHSEHRPQHDRSHRHLHVHQKGVHDPHQSAAHRHSHAAFFMGALHGSAGTGHLFALLPALGLRTDAAVAYLGAYFVAAVVAMTAFGAVLAQLANGQKPERLRALMYASSLSAVSVGLFWVGTTWPL